eukprot:gene43474-57877_t
MLCTGHGSGRQEQMPLPRQIPHQQLRRRGQGARPRAPLPGPQGERGGQHPPPAVCGVGRPPPRAAPAPPAEEVLLTEIRDLLKSQAGK